MYADYRVSCRRVLFLVQFFVHGVNKTFPVYSYAHATSARLNWTWYA